MKQAINQVIKNQIELVKPSSVELWKISIKTKEIIYELQQRLKKKGIGAESFVGGSVAKNTLIKKDKYDLDIFVRFDKARYNDSEISGLLGKIVPNNAKRTHGSRDYFSIKSRKGDIEIEIIPVLKIKKPEEAVNTTDLSYFHVNYVKNKLRTHKKLADEIRLTKAFAYYQDCYGAESYINGFSGYAVEVLVIYYGGFLKFIKAISKINSEQVIDPKRFYKNADDARKKLNVSKTKSPIILIDPTFKERNALASLSSATLMNFQKACVAFLRNPSASFFEIKDKKAEFEKRFGNRIKRITVFTNRQAGDIAGTKLKKFFKYFIGELHRFFEIKDALFDYNEALNQAVFFIAGDPKKEIVISGPPMNMTVAFKEFSKHHKDIRDKYGRAYAVEKNSLDFNGFLREFLNRKGKAIKEMGVKSIKII